MRKRITTLIKEMSEGVYEKEHILSLTLLCSISGESIFLLGPPGTAKSLVARRLKEVFSEKQSFEYLMSRFSTPDEIFGPVSISKLKNEDVYERRVAGYLPTATVVFLDEIWKAGPAIQNALLTAINERIYQNGAETIHLPMKGLIAASNELPKEDEGLEALWDRFLVRIVSNCITNEKTFYKMLRQKQSVKVSIPAELCITDKEYMEWQEQIEEVGIPDEVLKMITAMREGLKEASKKENVSLLDYYISDRRWKKIVHLLQASAFLNDRFRVDYSDLYLLAHTLWNKADDIPVIWEMLMEKFFADIDKKLDRMEKSLKQTSQKMLPTDVGNEEAEYKVYNYFYFKVLNYPLGNCFVFMSDYKHLTNQYNEGVIYWDEIHNAYLIRCVDVSQPFSGPGTLQSMKKVKLRRYPGWLEVGGKNYAIERDAAKKKNLLSETTEAVQLDETDKEMEKIRKVLEERVDVLTNGKNLFVAPDDTKMIRKQADKRLKRLEEMEVKIASLQSGAGQQNKSI